MFYGTPTQDDDYRRSRCATDEHDYNRHPLSRAGRIDRMRVDIQSFFVGFSLGFLRFSPMISILDARIIPMVIQIMAAKRKPTGLDL